jgi:hypothetical protein
VSRAAREELLEELEREASDAELAEDFRDAWLACAHEEPQS